MKQNTRFYICDKCGNEIGLIGGDIANIKCCAQPMHSMVIHDEFDEKHTPKYEHIENEIYVTMNHPMTKEHYIKWIALMSNTKTIRVQLYPEQDVEVRLPFMPNSILYAYCNKHGLWSTKVK